MPPLTGLRLIAVGSYFLGDGDSHFFQSLNQIV